MPRGHLDLAQWAVDDPGRWAQWAVPCPIKEDEVNRRKLRRHRKSRMDARTRERLPLLPLLMRTVNENRKAGEALLLNRLLRVGQGHGASLGIVG
jgi:hypothetical protein